MRLIPLIPAALIVLVSVPGFAQDWAPVTSRDDGFRANYPGQPKIEPITYNTEFRIALPGRVYRASDELGRYSTTVVDYREVERLHNERAAKCRAAKGANLQDGDACQNDFVIDVAGAMDHAASNFLKRDGVKVTQYGLYFVDVVSGRLMQLTNPDRSRTYAAFHQHAGRLYIHEATVPSGMPEPILFMQSLAWVNEQGLAIRYRTLYTEGYGDWRFPQPSPPHTLRDLDVSIDQPARPQ
ncbi:MAG TPA: hypothetical protein VIY56_15785 [Vicinamibacterales bacterium]